MDEHYDLVVVGSGPAGEKAAAMAAYHGKRVAVVERSPRPGGTMVGGVATTKTMREAALYLTSFRRRDVYGVGLELDPHLASQGVRSRSDRVEALLTRSVEENLERHRIELIRGIARLAGGGAVQVDPPGGGTPRVLTSRVVLLAMGSRPFHPPGMPFEHPDVLDSDSARRLGRPVRSLVVIGGGAVACEYASIFAALGSEVTLVESRGRLLPFMDAQIAGLLSDGFVEMGMRVMLGAGHAHVTADADGPCVNVHDGPALRPDKVIVAAGRVGNTDGLGLDAAGVEVNDHGLVVVDEHYATTASGIYAAGDVTGPPALASVSMEQGRVAICHAFHIALRDSVDSAPPFGVYSIPEVAMVGLTEDAARAAGESFAVGRARLSHNARTAITGAPGGLVKLLFRCDDHRLLGAHILGDNATELIHQAQAVLHFNGTVDYFVNSTFNVPTESEAYKYAAYDGLSNLENRVTLTTSA
jgi:NAD(P) transhydrogenase